MKYLFTISLILIMGCNDYDIKYGDYAVPEDGPYSECFGKVIDINEWTFYRDTCYIKSVICDTVYYDKCGNLKKVK